MSLRSDHINTLPTVRNLRLVTLLLVGILLLSPVCLAQQTQASVPSRIVLIIDDLGNQLTSGMRAVLLPGPVTYAFLPHTPYAEVLAELAHAKNKEVMLHLPLESHAGNRLGPGGLTLHMGRQEFQQTLAENIASIPHVRGVNNHMGSLMTRHPGAMKWLMQGLGEKGLYFIDSRTTEKSVAYGIAREKTIAAAGRDVFLDHDRNKAVIRSQFRRLLQVAKKRGQAIGIGHPFPETLEVLEQELPLLRAQGVELVAASELTKIHFGKRLWRVSSSPSLKVAKNSKQSP